MTHSPLRKEKNCLNCGQDVNDRYCPHCGQENREIRDSALHLVLHYVQDLFHYDGRLWHTLRSLMRHPGSVAVEYMEGKRRTHLEPIRFYVFASTVFFILLYVFVGPFEESTEALTSHQNYSLQKRIFQLEKEKTAVLGTADTMHVNALLESLRHQIAGDTVRPDTTSPDMEVDFFALDTTGVSEQKGLGRWITDRLVKKGEDMRVRFEGDPSKALAYIAGEIFHSLPKLLFLSLPFFAFLLKLLYLGSSRRLYVEHFIFSIYLYAYFFTLFMVWLLIQLIVNHLGWAWPDSMWTGIVTVLSVYPFIYLLLAMRRFYQDRWWSLALRFPLLVVLFSLVILLLFLILAFLTVII